VRVVWQSYAPGSSTVLKWAFKHEYDAATLAQHQNHIHFAVAAG
jgi:hypothetical protein